MNPSRGHFANLSPHAHASSGWGEAPLFILENKETGYAITDDHRGTVVLHGHGFSVVNYARITWARSAQVLIYWGDIDAAALSVKLA